MDGSAPAFFYQVAQALGENPRLPRTRRGDDPGATRGMADRRELVGGQVNFGHAVADRRERSRLRVPAVHDPDPAGVPGASERSSVDPEGCPVGELDVGRFRFHQPPGGKTPHGFAPVPPDRLAVASVVVVRPHQEVKALSCELESRAQAVDRQMAGLPLLQRPGVDRQLHHHGLARQPGPLQDRQSGVWLLERLLVDDHPRTPVPRLRRSRSRRDDNTTAKLGWPRCRHVAQPTGGV